MKKKVIPLPHQNIYLPQKNISTMRVKNFFCILSIALSLVLLAFQCGEEGETNYIVRNNTDEVLHITIYASAHSNDTILSSPQTIESHSKQEVYASWGLESYVLTFLSKGDSCIVRRGDAEGEVLKKWYRNYDLNSKQKEFFAPENWEFVEEQEYYHKFSFTINPEDLDLK